MIHCSYFHRDDPLPFHPLLIHRSSYPLFKDEKELNILLVIWMLICPSSSSLALMMKALKQMQVLGIFGYSSARTYRQCNYIRQKYELFSISWVKQTHQEQSTSSGIWDPWPAL